MYAQDEAPGDTARCANCSKRGSFQPVMEIKSLGVTILRYVADNIIQIDPLSTIEVSSGKDHEHNNHVFIIINANEMNLSSEDILPEFNINKVPCLRCRYRAEKVHKMLQSKVDIRKGDIRGICDHCKDKLSQEPCPICRDIIHMFLAASNASASKAAKSWFPQKSQHVHHPISARIPTLKEKQYLSKAIPRFATGLNIQLKVMQPESDTKLFEKSMPVKHDVEMKPVESKTKSTPIICKFPSDESIITPFTTSFSKAEKDMKDSFKYIFPKDVKKVEDTPRAALKTSSEIILATQERLREQSEREMGNEKEEYTDLKDKIAKGKESDQEKKYTNLSPPKYQKVKVGQEVGGLQPGDNKITKDKMGTGKSTGEQGQIDIEKQPTKLKDVKKGYKDSEKPREGEKIYKDQKEMEILKKKEKDDKKLLAPPEPPPPPKLPLPPKDMKAKGDAEKLPPKGDKTEKSQKDDKKLPPPSTLSPKDIKSKDNIEKQKDNERLPPPPKVPPPPKPPPPTKKDEPSAPPQPQKSSLPPKDIKAKGDAEKLPPKGDKTEKKQKDDKKLLSPSTLPPKDIKSKDNIEKQKDNKRLPPPQKVPSTPKHPPPTEKDEPSAPPQPQKSSLPPKDIKAKGDKKLLPPSTLPPKDIKSKDNIEKQKDNKRLPPPPKVPPPPKPPTEKDKPSAPPQPQKSSLPPNDKKAKGDAEKLPPKGDKTKKGQKDDKKLLSPSTLPPKDNKRLPPPPKFPPPLKPPPPSGPPPPTEKDKPKAEDKIATVDEKKTDNKNKKNKITEGDKRKGKDEKEERGKGEEKHVDVTHMLKDDNKRLPPPPKFPPPLKRPPPSGPPPPTEKDKPKAEDKIATVDEKKTDNKNKKNKITEGDKRKGKDEKEERGKGEEKHVEVTHMLKDDEPPPMILNFFPKKAINEVSKTIDKKQALADAQAIVKDLEQECAKQARADALNRVVLPEKTGEYNLLKIRDITGPLAAEQKPSRKRETLKKLGKVKGIDFKKIMVRNLELQNFIFRTIKEKKKKAHRLQKKHKGKYAIRSEKHTKYSISSLSIYSDSELALDSLTNLRKRKQCYKILHTDIVRSKHEKPKRELQEPEQILYHVKLTEDKIDSLRIYDLEKEEPQDLKEATGILRYTLSDRSFIDKGWTILPTEKIVRKLNIYKVRPTNPEFDWFNHNRQKGKLEYDTGEKLAEFDEDGRGRLYYKNGRLALDYYDCEEANAQQRFVVYSSGESNERCRTLPVTVLAMFDYLGSGVVFDHSGKIRIKYNQTDGVVLDRGIGPMTRWKWHTLNDPPILKQVMIDTHLETPDPTIMKFKDDTDIKRSDDEEIIKIEFDNFVKEKAKKMKQKFQTFQIKMKALKINEQFSLKILDQAHVYLHFNNGTSHIKINIGMVLDNQEIIDTETSDYPEVANSLERQLPKTDSLLDLQTKIKQARRCEYMQRAYMEKLRPTVPVCSADKLVSALSKPLRPPLPNTCPLSCEPKKFKRKPSVFDVYQATRLI